MILTLGLWAIAGFLLYSGSGNRTNRWMLSPLCIITMSLLFANYDRHKKRTVTLVQAGTILLIIAILFIYKPINFKYYQLHSKSFWYVMSAYNIGYAVWGFISMLGGIRREEDMAGIFKCSSL